MVFLIDRLEEMEIGKKNKFLRRANEIIQDQEREKNSTIEIITRNMGEELSALHQSRTYQRFLKILYEKSQEYSESDPDEGLSYKIACVYYRCAGGRAFKWGESAIRTCRAFGKLVRSSRGN
jgi:hypothetical protein